jgi:hypothetical protein
MHWPPMAARERGAVEALPFPVVEKLRMSVDNVDGEFSISRTVERTVSPQSSCSPFGYAAPNRTETSFDTPGSCIVTP